MGSKTNTRRLKRVYRCDECVRTFRSLQALNFHKKTHNSNASKQIRNKKQIESVEPRKIEQVFLKPEAKIAPVASSDEHGKKLIENVGRKIEFSCPKCDKSFNVYFSAFRHVQKYHCVDVKGNPVNPNSPLLIKPIRKEQCAKCHKAIKATEFHTCAEAPEAQDIYINRPAESYICTGCGQNFVSVKTFDVHIAGVHNDQVQSLFFPSKDDFTDWKQRVEKQVNCTYALMNRYASKDVYRCTYSPINDDSGHLHLCPSSFIYQKFTKGVQVHFYPDHHGHQRTRYIPSARDKQFCIKYLLEKAEGYQDIADMKLDSSDSYIEFKNLMEHIVLEAAKLDIKSLRRLMGKALQMSYTLKEYDEDEDVVEEVPGYTFDNKPNQQVVDRKSDKMISDAQIQKELLDTSIRTSGRIRRKSTSISVSDFTHEPIAKKPKIDPLTENANTPKKYDEVNYITNVSDKPELDESEPLAQLRIVDTFSLNEACLPKSSAMLLGNGNKKENGHNNNEIVPQTQPPIISTPPKNEIKTDSLNDSSNKKDSTPKVRFSLSQSQSFNDSYKEFVDKNFKAVEKPSKPKPKKQVMKTKIGQYNPNSPRRKSVSSPTLTPSPLAPAPRTYANTKKINQHVVKNDAKVETKLVSEGSTKPNSRIKTKPIHKNDQQSVYESVTKPISKSDTKVNPKSDTKVTPKSDTKVTAKNDIKPIHKSDTKLNRKSETKSIRNGEKKHKSEENISSKVDKKPLNKSEKKPLQKIEKKPTHENNIEKPAQKIEPKSILKTNRKSLDNDTKKPKRTKLLLNKSLEMKYEIKEQENDCNILVLKI